MDKLEYEGQWWVPGQDADRRITGTLTFNTENGLWLTTKDVLQPRISDDDYKEFRRYDIVNGITDGGMKITLCSANQVGPPMPNVWDKKFTERYECIWAFVGWHWKSPDEMKFRRISVDFNYLLDWTDKRSVRFLSAEELKDTGLESGFGYKRSENVVGDTKRGRITVGNGCEFSGDWRGRHNLLEKASIYIERDTYRVWLNQVIWVCQLICAFTHASSFSA